MRDTLGGRGVNRVSSKLLFAFKSNFKAFRSKKSSLREEDKALKNTFFLIYFTVSVQKSLKTVKKVKCHMGGGWSEKWPKKWPLTHN